MNKFKSFMTKNHTKNRECLHGLYTDRQIYISSVSSSEQPIEDEKIFYYRNVAFQFSGTGFRTPEKTILFVWIPQNCLGEMVPERRDAVVYEDFWLRVLSEPVNKLAKGFWNDHKDAREKPEFFLQKVNQRVLPRNGCTYDWEKEAFCLRLTFRFPLINGHGLNGKAGYKGMKALLDGICDVLENMDREQLRLQVKTYRKQLEIRQFMQRENLLAFVADGSILPREGESQKPFREAVPFRSPKSLRVRIALSDGEEISGMGLKRGITIITGGGYSGKSTLLDALEQGIYNHVCGDGREYCLTEEAACKIYAEDGRYLSNVDISPFFSALPGKGDVGHFSTAHASGSVSQAANIVEAVYGSCSCLLIDEDTSATNFMIRDKMMRKLVQKEPIIPFTDRVVELKEKGVSTVLVIGGSGEYLQYGDCILMLEDYLVWDKTKEVKQILEMECGSENAAQPIPGSPMEKEPEWLERTGNSLEESITHTWMSERYLPQPTGSKEFYISQSVQIENARYIRIDDYTADITRLTALGSEEQINSLTWMMERMLMETGREKVDLAQRCKEIAERLQKETRNVVFGSRSHSYDMCMEQVRGLDLLMALFRLRGMNFSE